MNKIKKWIGEGLLLIGIFIFFYNIFNFSSLGDPIEYYYQHNVIIMISTGAVLATIGILVIRQKNLK